jgi:hypothetical protein
MRAMILHAATTLDITTINHSFYFQPGRSRMEVNSVHANIDKQSTNFHVFDPVG